MPKGRQLKDRTHDGDNSFGILITDLRVALGITQMEVAHSCSVSKAHMSHIEHGKEIPSDELCMRLSKVLHCSPHILIREALKRRSPIAYGLLFESKVSHYDSSSEVTLLTSLIEGLRKRFNEDLNLICQVVGTGFQLNSPQKEEHT